MENNVQLTKIAPVPATPAGPSQSPETTTSSDLSCFEKSLPNTSGSTDVTFNTAYNDSANNAGIQRINGSGDEEGVKNKEPIDMLRSLGLKPAPRPSGDKDEEVHTIPGFGEVAATELTDEVKQQALEEFGLTDMVDPEWNVYQSVNEDGTVGFIFTDKNGNAVEGYTFDDSGPVDRAIRTEYTQNSDGTFTVKKHTYRIEDIGNGTQWLEEMMSYPKFVVDKDGHLLKWGNNDIPQSKE